jgi:hypothetical protein
MRTTLDTKEKIERYWPGSRLTFHGKILSARTVGFMPQLKVNGVAVLPSYWVWDLLVKTSSGQYQCFRGDPSDPTTVFSFGDCSRRRKDAEQTYENMLDLAHPIPPSRGGGWLLDGEQHGIKTP